MTQFCVERPVFTAMLFAGLVFLGGLNWGGLPVNLFPEINQPSLSVVTRLSDASPEEVEAQVTRPLEDELCVVKQLKRIYSVSENGVSTIIMDFDWSAGMDMAGLDVREKIDRARRKLPLAIEEPQIEKYSPASWPVMVVHFASRAPSSPDAAHELFAKVQSRIKPVVERARGVAAVQLSGGAEREIRVALDRARLGARRISAAEVSAALARENVSERGGVIKEGGRDLVVRTVGEFRTAEEIAATVIRSAPEGAVRLRDIAEVSEAPKARESFARLDGAESVQMSVVKEAEGNTVQVCKDVAAALEDLGRQFPDVAFTVTFDQSLHIGKALDMLKGNALGGALLCSLTLFFFLGRVSSTSIALFAMPLSIVPLSMLFKAFGVSLNIFSLTGIALGLGMVVDNAAIILENVGRHVEEGRLVREAAVSATTELSGAMVASTMTILAVFVPVLMVPGLVAQLFSSISYAISFSMAISLFISFTIVPMLAARQRLLTPGAAPAGTPPEPGALAKLTAARDRLYNSTFRDRLLPAYVGLLRRTIKDRGTGLAWLAACAALFALGVATLPDVEFMPKGRSDSFYANLDLPPDASLEETDRAAAQAEALARGLDGVKTCAAEVSASRARLLVVMKSASRTDAAMKRLGEGLALIPSLSYSLEKLSPLPNIGIGSGRGSDLAIKIKGDDPEKLAAYSAEVKRRLAGMKELQGARAEMEERVPAIVVRVSPEKAARYGLTAEEAAGDLKTALSGRVATKLRLEAADMDIRVTGGGEALAADQVGELTVWSPAAGNIKVKEIASLERALVPVRMEREERQRMTTVTAGLAPGAVLGKVLKKLGGRDGLIEGISWEPGYSCEIGGAGESMKDSFREMFKALAIGLVLVYMVMAAQFESLFQPLIIMTSVPLGFLGALLGLSLAGAPLNIMGLLGILMLGGVTVGSAIIMVDYINILRARGTDLHDAIVEAGSATLSPVLNTVGTTLADSVPLALAFGAGSELYRDLGITITAGLIVATLLTLFVIPLLYCRVEEAADLAALFRLRLSARLGRAGEPG